MGIAWIEREIIPFDFKECETSDYPPHMSDVQLYLRHPVPPLIVGKRYTFRQADKQWNPCRKYSVMAHVKSNVFIYGTLSIIK